MSLLFGWWVKRRATERIRRVLDLERGFRAAAREAPADYDLLIADAKAIGEAWRTIARNAYGEATGRDRRWFRDLAEHATRKAVEWRQRELDLTITRRNWFSRD